MDFKKHIYLLLFRGQLLRVKTFFRYFLKRKKTEGQIFSFNIWKDNKSHFSLKEINEMAFKTFNKRPLKVEFFSQSKFGHCSYKVFYDDENLRVLKCRECFSEDYAQKIEELTKTLNSNNLKIAPVLGRYKNFIFVKWIEGETIKLSDFLYQDSLIEKIARYQALIHSCSFPSRFLKNKTKSDYLDFLARRFSFFASKYVKEEEILRIVKTIKKLTPPLKPSITCPDLTGNNLVLEKGEPVLIDYETLNVDLGYEYDIITTQKNFFQENQRLQNYYLSLYKKYHSTGTLESNPDYWEIVYALKSAGSCFQRRDYQRGRVFVHILQKKLKITS
ncbi:MAG: hypothetical protein ACKKMW_01340 [Candidatus Nealsonbacteria bacterium]